MSDYRLVITKNNGQDLTIEFRNVDDNDDLNVIDAMRVGLDEHGYPSKLQELFNEWREVR